MDNKTLKNMEYDTEEDSISLTSTILSVHSENEFFEVKKILAENPDSKSETFLIKWEGYPISRATWEPRSQIRHLRPVMNEWRHRQLLEESGEIKPFDTAAWAAARQKSEDEKQDRKNRRLAKRRRLKKKENCGLKQHFQPSSDMKQSIDSNDQVRSHTSENFFQDDAAVRTKIEPQEMPDSEPSIYLNSKIIRAKRNSINQDNVEKINSLPVQLSAIHPRRLENADAALKQPKIPHLFAAEKKNPAPKTTKKIVTNQHRQRKLSSCSSSSSAASSSSSDEPLSRLIRRSKALEASTKATEEISMVSKNKPRVLISQLPIDSSSSSSESDLLENQSLSSLLKSRLIKASAISSVRNPEDISRKTPNLQKDLFFQVIPHRSDNQNPLNLPENSSSPTEGSKNSLDQSAGNKLSTTRSDPSKKHIPLSHNLDELSLQHQSNKGSISESLKLTKTKIQSNILHNDSLWQISSNQAEKLNHSEIDIGAFSDSVSNTNSCKTDKSLLPIEQRKKKFETETSAASSSKMLGSTKDKGSAARAAKFSSQINAKAQTCLFWDRRQNDKKENKCRFGKKCRFLHAYTEDSQLAPASKLRKEIDSIHKENSSEKLLDLNNGENKAIISTSIIPSAPKISDSATRNDNPDISVPLHLPKNSTPENSEEKTLKISQDSKPEIQNDDSMELDIEDTSDSVPSLQLNPDTLASTTSQLAQSIAPHFPMKQEKPQSTTLIDSIPKPNPLSSQKSTSEKMKRPAWNPKHPNNAVCYFFFKDGICQRSTCPFYHSLDLQVPVAPSPKQQRLLKKKTSEVCKFWLKNDCIHTASSCRFRHYFEPEKFNDDNPSDLCREQTAENTLAEKGSLIQKENISIAEPSKVQKSRNSTSLTPNLKESSTEVNLMPINSIETGTEAPGPIAEHNNIGSSALNREDEMSQPPDSGDNVNSRPLTTFTLHSETTAMPEHSNSDEQMEYEFENNALVIKEVTLGTDSLSTVALDFGKLENSTKNSWQKTFTSTHKIHFKRLCLAQDFQYQLGLLDIPLLWQGSVRTIDPDDLDATKRIDLIFNELVVRCAGILAINGNIAILMYPAKKEEWRFLDQFSKTDSGTRLCYSLFSHKIFQGLDSITAISAGSTSYSQFLVHKIQRFLIPDLLQDFVLKDDKNVPPGKIYLIFPPSASQMANFMKFCLFSYNKNFKIYGSMTRGSWEIFMQTTSYKSINDPFEKPTPGIVLIHESVATEICRLPKLSIALDKPEIVFWQISEGISRCPPYPSRYFPSNTKLGQITATKLFPHGCAVLLTPSFLVAEPTAALNFIKWFMVERFPIQITPWRIVGAYNLSQYILEVAKSKAFEALSYENRHSKSPSNKINHVLQERFLDYETCKKRWDLYTELSKLNTYSPDDSDFEDELEDCLIHASASIDPENEHDLIRWFAGWSTINLDLFRKFIVIGTGTSNAMKARYLKKITPKHANSKNPEFSEVATPSISVAAVTTIETTPGQKTSPTDPSKPCSRAQTLDSLIGEASLVKPPNPNPPTVANSSSRELFDPTGSNQGHSIIESHNGGAENPAAAPSLKLQSQSQTKKITILKADGQDLDKKNVQMGENSTFPNDAPVESNQAARPAISKKWKEIKFEATTEWYKRLQARGDAWEHITVVEHTEAWKLIGFIDPT